MKYFLIIIIFCLFLYKKLDKVNKEFYSIKEINKRLYILEDNYISIKNELNRAQLKWLHWPEKYLYENDNWKIIPLFAFGKWVSKYRKLFQITINILSKIPNIETILFSKLKPNTIIDPHRGWAKLSNHILRCHLPIELDETGINYIAVDKEKKYHKLGKLIIFDDSKLHYSVNKSEKERIVLIIDITRPTYIENGNSNVQETPELSKIIKKYL